MNCNEFIESLNTLDSLHPGPDLLDHSRECRKCSQKLDLERKLLGGFQVLKKLPPSPDFSKRVIKRLEGELGQRAGDLSVSEKLSRLFSPGSFFASPAFAGVIGLIILVFFWKIGHRGIEVSPKHPPVRESWEISLVSGKIVSGPGDLVAGGPRISLDNNKRVALTTGSVAELKLSGVAEIRLSGADFESGSDGFKLFSGNARVKVFSRPEGRNFVVVTPMGNVSVIGTEFSLELSEKALKVKVFEGEVKVETAQKTILLGPQQEEIISAKVINKVGIPEISSSAPFVHPASAPPSNE